MTSMGRRLCRVRNAVPYAQGFSKCYRIYSPISRTSFYLEYGLYLACGSYAQHTQRDKVFA